MSVATKDVHEAALIYVSGVTITGGGLASDHAQFSSLAHRLIVLVKAIVSVRDGEGLFHLNRNRGGKSIMLFILSNGLSSDLNFLLAGRWARGNGLNNFV